MIDTLKKRVAAYIRVGGIGGAIADMLETEKAQFEAGIRNHENWVFAGCYADSCPAAGERPGLTRLLNDCRAGKIDIIVTNDNATAKAIATYVNTLIHFIVFVLHKAL